ncbi:major capsid protein [Halarsenatibacter silvermanii]|uniref:Phage major capsid protein E n=1 Tax=Halarsenatibacter silvermanii TaxID=321763 RepID=A0A1G9RB89_9FIRM|nr:major capsid protein [Halarsenatibacter silvermanii]SDM20569.1 Phage major capsid protein E [Halarsenatibacter silvermanii]
MDKNKLIQLVEDKLGVDYLGFIEEITDPAGYIGNRFLPAEEAYDFEWVHDIFDNTHAVAKMKARGDAEAPIVGGPAVKKVSGSLAPFGQKFQVNKSTLNKIFNPRNDSELYANLRRILDESARNVNAALSRAEWLRFKFLAEGEIAINEGDISLEVDMGIPDDNKLAHGTSDLIAEEWSEAASAKPLDDIVEICEHYFTVNGEMPNVILMRRATLLELLNADDTQNDDNKGLKSLAEVNDYLGRLGMDYPEIETYDEFVRFEDVDGRPSTVYHLIPKDRVVLLKEAGGGGISSDIGRLLMGPVAENDFQPGIYVDVYEETDPKKYWHYMACEMWPAGYNPEYIVHADV